MITLKFINAVITKRGWRPYIKGHWFDVGTTQSGVIISFKGHENIQYKCSCELYEDLKKRFEEVKNAK